MAAAVGLTGCVRLSAPPPPDATGIERAVATAQAEIDARSVAFRNVLVRGDVGTGWHARRDGNDRAGATSATVDRVVSTCAGGPDPLVTVDSPEFVLIIATEKALVATQEGARSLALVFADGDAAAAAFRTYEAADFASCVTAGLLATDEDRLLELDAGPVPQLRTDDATTAARFAGVYDVDGSPVAAWLDVVVLHRDRVVTLLELSSVGRPFQPGLRDELVTTLRKRMSAPQRD